MPMSASGPSPVYYSSLFAHPQPPLGFIWAPTTLKGAKASHQPQPRAHEQRHEREVERTYLMGSCGKYVLPRVRLDYRQKRSVTTSSNSPSSGASAFEPPLVLVASSSSQAGWGEDCSTANNINNLQFAAMPGDVLWEECPSMVFTDTAHLATLMAGIKMMKNNGSGNSNAVKAEEKKEENGDPPRVDRPSLSPSIPQGLAAIWSMLLQKKKEEEKEGGGAREPTHPFSVGGASQQQQKIQREYGRGFSAISTGLIETIRSRQEGKDDDRWTKKISGEQSPVVEVCSSLQDGLSAIGFYQSAAVWRTLRKLERKRVGGSGGSDASTGSQGASATTAENEECRHNSVEKLIAPAALAASATSLLGLPSSSFSALYSFPPAPPLMSLDKYFLTKDAASGPTAVMTMVQKVLARCAVDSNSSISVSAGRSKRSNDEGEEAGGDRRTGKTAGDGSFCVDNGHTHVRNTITRPLFEVGIGKDQSDDDDGKEEEDSSIASAAFACLWRLCQERSLLLLKDPDGAPEGTNLAGADSRGVGVHVGGASSILKGLIAAQQQNGRGDEGKSDGGVTVEEALSAFCPIAAMANFTKLSTIANAQLVIVQQAMPIVYETRSGNNGGEVGEELSFRYRFVVQAVATRPIRKGEEIRLPIHLLASSAASIPIIGASTVVPNTSSQKRVSRPAIGLASSTHLSLALKQITDAIAKNPTASAAAATRNKKEGGGDTQHAASVDGSLGNGGEGVSDSLGMISPYYTNIDYRRHLEKVRGSLEQYVRQGYVGGALGDYLTRSHTSKMKAGELLDMMQRAAAAKAGGGI